MHQTSRSSICLYVKMPEEASLGWTTYFLPLSLTSWIITMSIVLLSAMLLSLPYYVIPKSKDTYNFGMSFLATLSSLFQQGNKSPTEQLCLAIKLRANVEYSSLCSKLTGMDQEPNNLSSRMSFLAIFFTSLVVYAKYSAALTAFLAIKKLQMPFDNLLEMYLNTDYKIAFLDQTVLNERLKNGDVVERKLLAERFQPITSLDEGLGFMERGKYAVAWDDTAIALKVGRTCKVAQVKQCLMSGQLVWATPKQSPFNGIISYK